jgi:hypothetical protein
MSKEEMGAKTVVHKAHSKSKSLRATIPAKIIKEFGLKESDVLDWEIATKDGKKVLIVRKMIVG